MLTSLTDAPEAPLRTGPENAPGDRRTPGDRWAVGPRQAPGPDARRGPAMRWRDRPHRDTESPVDHLPVHRALHRRVRAARGAAGAQRSRSTRPSCAALTRRRGSATGRPSTLVCWRATLSAFHCERREWVFARERRRLGTAMTVTSSGSRVRDGPTRRRRPTGSLGAAGAVAVAALELLDTAGGVHDALRAGPERVRLAGHVDHDERVGLAVLPLHGALAGQRGTGEELGARARVLEDHRVVVGVDVVLHYSDPSSSVE